MLTISRKTTNAVNAIWKDIIRPERPSNIGNVVRCASYFIYKNFIAHLNNKEVYDEIDLTKKTCCNLDSNQINGFQPLLKKVFKNIDSVEERKSSDYENAIFWGAKLFKIEKLIEYSIKKNIKHLFFVEDGFYRSVCGGLKKVEKKYSISHSLIFDDLAPHYDGNHVSRFEKIILDDNIDYIKNSKEIEILKKYIINNHITKYNDQPIYESIKIGVHKEKVLVIMQSYNDASINIVGGDENIFCKMIEDAISENNNADILIKVHPDTLIKKNKGYIDKYLNDNRVYIIDFEINLCCLLNYCNKIYVFSSQAGFEALLYGKEVYCYGKPFYSGLGLTHDRGGIREKGHVPFDKLFYDLHWRYTQYFDPETGKRVNPIVAIKKIKSLRDEYFAEKTKKKNVLIIKLDGMGDWVLYEQHLIELKKMKEYQDAKFYLLGDKGFKEYCILKNSDLFHGTFWINKRGSRFISYLLKPSNILFINRINRLIMNLFLHIKLRKLYKLKYKSLIVSCWNNKLQKFINIIAKDINADKKYGRAIFKDYVLETQQKKIYTDLIPMSGDHLRYFRGDIERIFLENIAHKKLLKREYKYEKKEIHKVFMFASAYAPKRRWPSNKFLQLAETIVKNHNIDVCIYGAESDLPKQNRNPRISIYTGKSDFTQLDRDLMTSDMYIGNDTGFYHIAVSYNKRCIVISNGNSLKTFLVYPENKNINYVFPNSVSKIIESGDINKIKSITKSSDYDITQIEVNHVYNIFRNLTFYNIY